SGSGAFSFYDVTNVYNLAGKNAANWGTPFDLNELANNNLVLGGFLDLGAIQYVRLVDVVGSGSILSGGSEIPGIAKDSHGNPILDNWVTTGSSGFDYVGLPTGAIGVVNSVPEPSALVIGACFTGLLLGRRRAARLV
ncbi:MAG: cell surface protein, partial [Akkermansiaceae bacterium]|nr:cell surface protein [Akkermansiaceae bacterium]